jgi:hypothetical protein
MGSMASRGFTWKCDESKAKQSKAKQSTGIDFAASS